MENNKTEKDVYDKALYDEIERICKPIFEEVAKEGEKNRVLVGSTGSKGEIQQKYILWQPHHYRLYFLFNKQKFLSQTDPSKAGFHLVNSTEWVIKDWEGCTFRVKKNLIEIFNKIEHKRWYRLALSSDAKYEMQNIVKKKNQEIKDTLKKFIETFGGDSDYLIQKEEIGENKVMNEEIIDSIPLNAQFYNKVGKKVYKEPSFEFDSLIHQSNYIENQALKSALPDLNQKLEKIDKHIEKTLKESKVNSELITSILRITETQAKLNGENARQIGQISKLFKSQIPQPERISRKSSSIIPEYIG